MPDVEELARQIGVCDAVCAKRWKHLSSRLGRIEAMPAMIVPLLLIDEGAVIEVLKRVLGG